MKMEKSKAQLDFVCAEPGCDAVVKFDLTDVAKEDFQTLCPKCHKPYQFLALRHAEPILGDCCVAVAVPGGEVKIPYALLLTRLNTMISLNVGDKKIDFHLRIEPTSSDTFR